ncbi:MAG: tyrosine-type recombinase/integrase [Candidatus Binataceae bacterium]
MTQLRKMMLEELQRRNYAQNTVKGYLRIVQDFAEHFHQRPDKLGPDHLRQYQAHLFQDRKLNAGTVQQYVAALRFFFNKTLKRRYLLDDLPMPKRHRKLPEILSPDEVALLIGSASNLFHQTILMTLYATGIRSAELCNLKTSDIDSERMMVHIHQGKGGRDRDVPLSQKLLETLRVYWRWMKPKTYLFPGTVNNWRADVPVTTKAPWEVCHQAAQRAGIAKHVSPHTLRHCYATHLLESGTDLRTIQLLLGHAKLEHTALYLQLSQKHLSSGANPLDAISTSNPENSKRSRKLQKR